MSILASGERPCPSRWSALAVTVLVLGAGVAACGGSSAPTQSTTETTASLPTSSPTPTAPSVHPVTWLCRPGLANDPCTSDPSYTQVLASGSTHSVITSYPPNAPVDCFYVYPTVATGTTANAPLVAGPAETAVAVAQASRFSDQCEVYAPVYRQLTLGAVNGSIPVTSADVALAYSDVLNAWDSFLLHDNNHRGIVLIGVDQGADLLVHLMKSQMDHNAQLRLHLVGAILLGADIQVAPNQTTGGTFSSIPVCSEFDIPGCIITYSAFRQVPPAGANFGHAGANLDQLTSQSAIAGDPVACVNPAAQTSTAPGRALATGLNSFFPTGSNAAINLPDFSTPSDSKAATPWVNYPNRYLAQCQTNGSDTWLQVDLNKAPGDKRPGLDEGLGSPWGLDPESANLALGDLVSDVQQLADAYSGNVSTPSG